MGLKLWLPLNGDLENKGTSITTITNDGATIDNSGKIGKCYSFANTHIIIDSTEIQNLFSSNTQSFSMTCWIYLNSDETDRVIIFGNYSANPFVNWELAANCTPRLCAGGTSNYTNRTNSTVVPKTTWTHLAVTYDGTNTTFYQNGISVGTVSGANTITTKTSSSRFYIGSDTRNDATRLKGKMNDFRLYDYALSPAEVHEISQGLVLHYKLDVSSGGFANSNLLTGNVNEASTWTLNQATATNDNGGIRVQITSDTGDRRIYRGVTNVWTPANSTFTVSFEAKAATNNITLDVSRSNIATDMIHFPLTTRWQHYSGQIVNTAAVDGGTLSIRCVTNGAIFWVRNVKLERGEVETRFLSSTESSTVIQDSSGYGHNGSIYGTTQLISDSPRYSTATELTSTSSHINASGLVTSGFGSSYSFVWWAKSNSTANMHWGFSDGIRLNGLYNGNLWNTGDSNNNPLYKPGTTTGISVTEANVWHHWAMTGDGTTCKVYKDGVHVANAKTWKAISGTSLWFNGWSNSTSYAASSLALSDFRLYATALSADDIKQLYQVGAKVDNLQGLHTFEIKETNCNLLAGRLWTSPYDNHNPISALFTNFNSKGEYQFTANSTSAGSEYIPINPTGHTYEYDYTISVNTGNKFYIGFERYDANKTARSNNACIYTYSTKPSSDVIRQHFTGTVDLSTDGTNPCAFIALRILNGWSGTTSGVTGTATIHSFSLREIGTKQNPKLTKQGQFIEEELKEETNMKLHKNGIIETNTLIEK